MSALATTQQTTLTQIERDILNRAIETGDLAGLSSQARTNYYYSMCQRYGLDPLSRPFDYIKSYEGKGDSRREKLAIYLNQRGGSQLRKNHQINIEIIEHKKLDGLHIVKARATRKDGTSDEATGVVPIVDYEGKPLSPTAIANAIMKAEGKARHRVTMAICGLQMPDPEEKDRTIEAEVLDHGLEPTIEGEVVEMPQLPEKKKPPAWVKRLKEARLKYNLTQNEAKKLASDNGIKLYNDDDSLVEDVPIDKLISLMATKAQIIEPPLVPIEDTIEPPLADQFSAAIKSAQDLTALDVTRTQIEFNRATLSGPIADKLLADLNQKIKQLEF